MKKYFNLFDLSQKVDYKTEVLSGVEYVFATVILAGILQLIAGFLKLAKFMRLIPHPVIFGFVNGLAIIIFMSQLDQFKTTDGTWITGNTLYIFVGRVLLSMLIIWGLPKLTKTVPASLTAILVVFGLVTFLNIDTRTVGDMASIQGTFPPFHIPQVPLNWETFTLIFPYAAIVAGVGLIESLLTLNIIDEITETRGRGNKDQWHREQPIFFRDFSRGWAVALCLGRV